MKSMVRSLVLLMLFSLVMQSFARESENDSNCEYSLSKSGLWMPKGFQPMARTANVSVEDAAIS